MGIWRLAVEQRRRQNPRLSLSLSLSLLGLLVVLLSRCESLAGQRRHRRACSVCCVGQGKRLCAARCSCAPAEDAERKKEMREF